MKFDEYINWRISNGEVDLDGAYGYQCMDLYNEYCQKVLELTGNTGADYAKNIIHNQYVKENFEFIYNYPDFVPQKGDVAVWLGGTYGHVAICLGPADLNTFITLDQNWVPQKLTQEFHNYLYMCPLVFLRPHNQKNIKDEELPHEYNHKIGELVVYSSCYYSNNDVPPNYVDCIRTYGAWQQRYITEIVGGHNPYKLENGMYLNDGDIREVK